MALPGRIFDQTEGRSPFAFALDIGTLALLGLAVWLVFFASSDRPEATARTAAASVAPADLEAIDADGSVVPLLFDHGGSHLVLLFRTDCSVCERELPHWMELAELAEDQGVEVTAVTAEERTPATRTYFDDAKVRLLHTRRPERLSRAFRTRVVPTTVLVSADGDIVFHSAGKMHGAARDSLRRRLGEPDSP